MTYYNSDHYNLMTKWKYIQEKDENQGGRETVITAYFQKHTSKVQVQKYTCKLIVLG